MAVASTALDRLQWTYGDDGSGGVFTVGEDDYLRFSIFVRKGDDGLGSFLMRASFDTHTANAVLLATYHAAVNDEWVTPITIKAGTGTNAVTIASADPLDIYEDYTSIPSAGADAYGWTYVQITLNLKWLRDNTTLTSASKVYFTFQYEGTASTFGVSTYDINLWGLHLETANSTNDLATSYFGTTEVKTLNVANAIYVLNPDTTVYRTSDKTALVDPQEAVIWVRSVNFSTVYTVTLENAANGVAEFKVVTVDAGANTYTPSVGGVPAVAIGAVVSATGDKADGATVVDVSNDAVAEELYNLIFASAGTHTSFEGWEDSIIYIKAGPDDEWVSVQTSDSLTDENIVLLWQTVETDADLPTTAPNGFRITLTGDPETGVDESYAIFSATSDEIVGEEIAAGVWVEDAAPGSSTTIDKSTMPHILRLLEDDSAGTVTGTPFEKYFTYGARDYSLRLVGDDDTNPFPPFVSVPTGSDPYVVEERRKIQSMFFVDNRLGFTSVNDVCLSASGDLDNFFKKSVTRSDPADRIFVTANHKDATEIHSTEVSQGQVVLLTKKVQFVMEGLPAFTRDTVSIRPITEFESDPRSEAQVTQYTVAVPFTRERYLGLNELRQTNADSPFDVFDSTEAVPQYIVGRALDIKSSSVLGTITILNNNTQNDPYGNEMAVQRYLWADRRKVQQAWHKWKLGNTPSLLRHLPTEDFVYFLVERGGKVCVERLTLDPSGEDTTASYALHLDGQMSVASDGANPKAREIGYDYGTTTAFKTTLTFPTEIDVSAITAYYKRGATGGDHGTEWSQAELLASNWTWDADAKTLTSNASVDYTSGLGGLQFGYKYTSKVELHENYLLEPSLNRGLRARLVNQFDLQQLTLKLRGVHTFTVTSDFGDWGSFSETYVGDIESNVPQIDSLSKEFTVMGPGDECVISIQTSEPQPLGIASIEMLGREGGR